MAKLAESLVIEYFSRQSYLSAQSIKKGYNEWDVLAIKYGQPSITAKHIEVQVSFDPVGYLSGKSAAKRTDEQVNLDMKAWVNKKFENQIIENIRKSFYDGDWSFVFIHGVIKDSRELDYLRNYQPPIEVLSFSDVIANLCSQHPRSLPFTSETKDLVEIIRYAIQCK